MSGQKPLNIVFVLNKSNNFGLKKDAEILEEGIRLQGKICNVEIGTIKHMDPRESPVLSDICIHFEEPYAVWFPWARQHCIVVNPEWWVDEWSCYRSNFSQWIFKTSIAQERFIKAGLCSEETSFVMRWRSKGKIVKGDVKYNSSSIGWVWFLGGSVNKRAAATEILPLWSENWLPVTVYTTSSLELTGLAKNVTVKIVDLSIEEHERLALYYPGHICVSKTEGFGHTASEAQHVGAFTMLNTIDTYKEYYTDSTNSEGVVWINTPTSVEGMHDVADFTDKKALISDLADADISYRTVDLEKLRLERREKTIAENSKWDKDIHSWFLKMNKMLVDAPKLPKFCPPILATADCPPISIITLVYGRPKFLDLAFHNLMLSDYPREKMEWVVVDDSPADESASDKIMAFEQRFFPGKIRFIPLPKKVTIGRKRNIGCRRAAHGVILMMDDDDHYPQTSFRRRVAWLLKDRVPHKAAVCTSIAMYDLNAGLSAVNVPPFRLGLSARVSEATLTFTADFWQDRPFLEVDMAEGEEFLKGRESDVVEMPPQQIIVSFTHGKNSSSRKVGTDATNGCFWGFPRQYLEFIHGLVGVTVEEEK